jgi:hypothetical protein
MASAWETLQRAGVPLGTRDEPPALADPDSLAGAVREAMREPAWANGSERERVALLAWLRAWSAEWPTSFAATFGAEGHSLLLRAQEGEWDRGRYLKLRRLARETLSRIL